MEIALETGKAAADIEWKIYYIIYYILYIYYIYINKLLYINESFASILGVGEITTPRFWDGESWGFMKYYYRPIQLCTGICHENTFQSGHFSEIERFVYASDNSRDDTLDPIICLRLMNF